MSRNVLPATCMLILLGAVAGLAQEVHKITADVPHPFSVSGRQFEAGRYQIELPGRTHTTVIIRSLDGRYAAQALIMRGIAASSGSEEKPRLVFETIGDQYVLSEVWMPGHEGFLLAGVQSELERRRQ